MTIILDDKKDLARAITILFITQLKSYMIECRG